MELLDQGGNITVINGSTLSDLSNGTYFGSSRNEFKISRYLSTTLL